MTILYMQYSLVIDAILTSVKKIIPGLHNDRTGEWKRMKKEAKALCAEIHKYKDRDD
jgi:hypothetical protein